MRHPAALVVNGCPEAVGWVIASGVTLQEVKGFSASLRLRYFGPRDLTSDAIYRSNATALLNADVGYRINETWRVSAEFFNLLNRRDHDIDYAYAWRRTQLLHAAVAPESIIARPEAPA